MGQRKAVTKEMAKRYRTASKRNRGVILDELCALTGWSRDHARRALRTALARQEPHKLNRPRPRTSRYGEDVVEPLRKIWATLDGMCGKRLAPFMAEMVEVMERTGELQVSPSVREKLCSISAATLDRKLAPDRRRLSLKGRSRTKPGTMLKNQIPIRTFSQWDEARPGFMEADLVAHDGGDPRGDYCHSLDLTDVATGWTEPRALKNRASRWVQEAVSDIESSLPFPLLGLDSDNGSEFINNHLVAYLGQREVTFTRSRPWRKNDSCYVEEKNWSVVRRAVGYARYDTDRELEVLTELYGHLRLYVNFFCPHMKLTEKTREGAKVTKRYDRAQTPYRRLLASERVTARAKAALTHRYRSLNPVQLKRAITDCQDNLLRLTRLKEEHRRKEARER